MLYASNILNCNKWWNIGICRFHSCANDQDKFPKGCFGLDAKLHMWHDQGKWVTCRQYSILSFQYNLLAHIKSYILIHTPLQSDIWSKRYEQFFEFQNNVKQRNMSSVLAYNSKSILATSDSFPLIMSHILLCCCFLLLLFFVPVVSKIHWFIFLNSKECIHSRLTDCPHRLPYLFNCVILFLLQESVSIVDTLTGCPHIEDLLMFGLPVCAPYPTMQNFK